ncbi:RNA-binding S4 domain-containing protein [Kineosporia sp. J2-2]|uniref:RNA-binding S4 domain-containing protein n=1 Tax=Kineosporia corallincola TaxID=2835133 RepID=A0ABS5TJS2_9ACTN|nr:RNA-binding S4 domain-containing protein [Kineosporia corallincola]MBT0770639.1 RNA-binding S4 domain-containing protein [Kineosporia corallincola]
MDAAEVRLDVWIWSVRLFKSRSVASSACRGGHVAVNGAKAKPSTTVRVGDRIEALTTGGERIAVVRRLIQKRVGAAVAVTCYEDLTPAPPPKEEIVQVAVRDRGAGRPTKRDRRQLDRLRPPAW